MPVTWGDCSEPCKDWEVAAATPLDIFVSPGKLVADLANGPPLAADDWRELDVVGLAAKFVDVAADPT